VTDIKNYYQLTVQKIAQELNMKRKTVRLILTKDLNMKKVSTASKNLLRPNSETVGNT
jgi:orotate phosphoribosyltransferase-like protein